MTFPPPRPQQSLIASPGCVPPPTPTGRLYVLMPVAYSKKPAPSPRWRAYFDPESLDLHNPSIFILPPASASVGFYRFRLSVLNGGRWKADAQARFALLCNPWCFGESLTQPPW